MRHFSAPRPPFFAMPTWSTLPAWVMVGAFSLTACAPDTGDDAGGNAGGSGGGEDPGETTPDASGAGGGSGGAGGAGGAIADAGPEGGQRPDMATGLLPDGALISMPDAGGALPPDALVPTPDAFAPAPDAFVPAPDAFVPVPDAFVPAPDAFVPAPDAFIPAPDAFIPAPDAFVPPPDAFVPAPDAFIPPPDHCGPGSVMLGEFATHCGQVNVLRPAGGDWTPDADCSTGCDVQDLAYCQAEFPGSTRIVPVEVGPEDKPFFAGGCGEVYPQRGSAQFACCAPAPICPEGQRLVGRFATQCGMVNVHADPDGPFSVDDDCASGCNINDVAYCQRFWPESVSVAPMDVAPGNKPFTDAGCGMVFDVPGQAQYGCCAPILD